MIFQNRQEAAELLAAQLAEQKIKDPLVIALPRGGVPVAAAIARTLHASLDVLIVRKLGAPQNPEYGIGAIAENGFYVTNPEAIQVLGIEENEFKKILHSERLELQRRVEKFRGSRHLQKIKGRTVLVVDDGLATGITAQVAIEYLKAHGAKKVIFCAPICSAEGARLLEKFADEVVCLHSPENLWGVGLWYSEFHQLSDEEVIEILSQFPSSSPRRTNEDEKSLDENVEIKLGKVSLQGILTVPPSAKGLILFAHGSGSSRLSPRNRQVARTLQSEGFATLLFDLLTPLESKIRAHVFDIGLLADRLIETTRWLRKRKELRDLPIGYFGASTGGGAALWAAAELGAEVSAVVSRGGRPDLAKSKLAQVSAPVLLIVGGEDPEVLSLNQESLRQIHFGKLTTVAGATHVFEEPGALEKVAELALKWFQENLRSQNPIRRQRLTLSEEVERRARPLRAPEDLQPLIDSVRNSKVVMLGEASHGTHEFYHWRKLISQELIQNHGFRFIAVEGDWPPCQRIHQFIQTGEGKSAEQVLQNFRRWPTWMWANREIVDLVHWLHDWNQDKDARDQIGFHGLDVYSLFESIDEVERLMRKVDPELVAVLRDRYTCFEPSMRDEKKYVKSLLNFAEGCEEEALENLKELLKIRLRDGAATREKIFDATQNARIVANAEHYYRSMIYADDESWNIRDRHMMETLDLLLQRYGKGIVWEHNTHIGDYRATDMAAHGQVNIGGLAREEWGRENVSLVGFGTYEGSVIASHAWAGPMEAMRVPPGKSDSIESHFHSCVSNIGSSKFYLLFDAQARQTALAQTLGHRAIGVVYDPTQERRGNYVPTSIADRYDAFVYFDRTRPISPLQAFVEREEIPETFPSGI